MKSWKKLYVPSGLFPICSTWGNKIKSHNLSEKPGLYLDVQYFLLYHSDILFCLWEQIKLGMQVCTRAFCVQQISLREMNNKMNSDIAGEKEWNKVWFDSTYVLYIIFNMKVISLTVESHCKSQLYT